MAEKIYRIDYYSKKGNVYKRKYVRAIDVREALHRARLKSAVDMCVIPEDSKELEGKKIL